MSEPGPQSQPDEAMVDLLIKQVTEGLSPAEQRALDVLDSAVASAYLRDFERAAAAISLAASASDEPPPAALKRRLEESGQAFLATTGGRVVELKPATAARPRPFSGGSAGWLAAAACLLLAVFGWLRSPEPAVAPVVVQTAPPPPVIPAPPAAPTPAEERAALLAKANAIKLDWGATKDAAAKGVTGDVVWDPATQRGYLRFVGLPQNDPQTHQYQLWIFDAKRDKRYPVDGGVFDVPANATEVLVPIHAALPVHQLAAFAVTIEKPGGVVVSGREHVVVLAQPG